jgi:hypothetical protein
MKQHSVARVVYAVGAAFAVMVSSSCGSSSSDGFVSEGSGSSTPSSSAPEYFYGEEGGPAPGTPPRRCPPPLSGLLDTLRFSWDSADYATWRDTLGGKKCYGNEGVYNSCGDGYGDEFMGFPPEDGGACVGERLSGLPYSLSVEQRTATAIRVIGGECFTDIKQDQMVLSDCRLEHVGRVVWGRKPPAAPGENLAGICDANRESWEGFSETRLIRSPTVFACVALRPSGSQ